jgi:cupin fold WbuC family metalloprotein
MNRIQSLNETILDRLFVESRENPRRRVMFCFSRHEDNVQRMINVMQPGACPRPHWHPRAGCKESVVVLRGSIGLFLFDPEDGAVTDALRLDPVSCPVADIPSGAWHTFLPLEADTAVFETKSGPWDAATDKEFASWAPEEDAPEAESFRLKLIDYLNRQ